MATPLQLNVQRALQNSRSLVHIGCFLFLPWISAKLAGSYNGSHTHAYGCLYAKENWCTFIIILPLLLFELLLGFQLAVVLLLLETVIAANINDSTIHQLPDSAIAKIDMPFERCLSSLEYDFPNKQDKRKQNCTCSTF